MMRERHIDHVVLAVPDLDAAAAAYEAQGFTLTPRARHPDHMGTSNRLALFANKSFIEILEVDRPDSVAPHDLTGDPPAFAFGAHNKAQLAAGGGLSYIVFASEDAAADRADWAAKGLRTYAPFGFERQAKQPDGETVTVSFELAFVTDPALPGFACFSCHNRRADLFWREAYMHHANGAAGIAAVTLAAADPRAAAAALAKMTGGAVREIAGGLGVSCGSQAIHVLTPAAAAALGPDALPDDVEGLAAVGITLIAEQPLPPSLSRAEGQGCRLDWTTG